MMDLNIPLMLIVALALYLGSMAVHMVGKFMETWPDEADMGVDWAENIGQYVADRPPGGVSADLWFEFICAVELGLIDHRAGSLAGFLKAFNNYLAMRELDAVPSASIGQMLNILRATGRTVKPTPNGVENWMVMAAIGGR